MGFSHTTEAGYYATRKLYSNLFGSHSYSIIRQVGSGQGGQIDRSEFFGRGAFRTIRSRDTKFSFPIIKARFGIGLASLTQKSFIVKPLRC